MFQLQCNFTRNMTYHHFIVIKQSLLMYHPSDKMGQLVNEYQLQVWSSKVGIDATCTCIYIIHIILWKKAYLVFTNSNKEI